MKQYQITIVSLDEVKEVLKKREIDFIHRFEFFIPGYDQVFAVIRGMIRVPELNDEQREYIQLTPELQTLLETE